MSWYCSLNNLKNINWISRLIFTSQLSWVKVEADLGSIQSKYGKNLQFRLYQMNCYIWEIAGKSKVYGMPNKKLKPTPKAVRLLWEKRPQKSPSFGVGLTKALCEKRKIIWILLNLMLMKNLDRLSKEP